MKILIAGNSNYGAAQALKHKFPKATFLSRSCSDTDLSQQEEQVRIGKMSLEFDVFISCSSLFRSNQLHLVREVVQNWETEKKDGYIIVFGSSADTPVKATSVSYHSEKKGLRSYCRGVSNLVLGGHGKKPPGFKITYLSPGYIDTEQANSQYPGVMKLDPGYISNLIEWLLAQPKNVNISELCLDPIQI